MPWKALACLLIVILGFVVFLYGANYYDATFGWIGFSLFVGGIVLYVVLKLLEPKQNKQAEG
jgi:hypothetical protein